MTPHRAARKEAQCSRINRRGESDSKSEQKNIFERKRLTLLDGKVAQG